VAGLRARVLGGGHQKTRAKIFTLSLTTGMLSILFLFLMARTFLFVTAARFWPEIAVGTMLLCAGGFISRPRLTQVKALRRAR
jgi:hypothetical protein